MLKQFRMSRLGNPRPRAARRRDRDEGRVAGGANASPDIPFSAVYDRFRFPIRAYIATRITDAADQDELTQEVFLKAFRSRKSYDPAYEFSTWLWTVARNTVSDWLRKRQPAIAALATARPDTEVSVEDFPCARHDAEARMIQHSQRRNLLRLFRHLTRPQRRVLWLRIIHQRSYQEIGRQLGLSLPSVKNLSLRAKMKLAQVAGSQPCLA